jgi:uncharacterized membrane protein
MGLFLFPGSEIQSMWKSKKLLLKLLFLSVFLVFAAGPAVAGSVVYVPLDDRPYSLDRVIEAARALKVELLLPPAGFFRGQEGVSDFGELFEWLTSNSRRDAFVIAADALLYGGLVSSRTHDLREEEVLRRFEFLKAFCAGFSKPRIALFGTLLRMPRESQGILDADYNAKWAPQLFRLARLQTAASRGELSGEELAAAERLLKTIPVSVLRNWAERRNRSLRAANRLLALHGTGGVDFVGIGLDDNVCPQLLEAEFRSMATVIGDAPKDQVSVVPGVDQMGLLLFARMFLHEKPLQKVFLYFPRPFGLKMQPNYSGFTPEESLEIQAEVLGVKRVDTPQEADLILVVNLPPGDRTLEASSPLNSPTPNESDEALVAEIGNFLAAGKRVALADIAFDNGADRGLMEALRKAGFLDRLSAYSGGNTSDNSLGVALATGVLSAWMGEADRKWLLFARYLDDWGYQAVVRPAVAPKGPFAGQAAAGRLEGKIREQLFSFSQGSLEDFGISDFDVSYPWGRLFEIRITPKIP